MYYTDLFQITQSFSYLFSNRFDLKWLKWTTSLIQSAHINTHVPVNIKFQMLKHNNHVLSKLE